MSTRRSNGEGSIYKRKDGVWVGALVIGTKRKYIYANTQKEARKRIKQLIAEKEQEEFACSSTMTLNEWADIWLTDYMMGKRDSTIAQYTMYLKKRVLPAIGHYKLSELDTHKIQHWYTKLSKEVEPKTVRNIHGILHSLLEKALKLGYIRINPANACELPKVIRKEMHPILDDNLPVFLNKIRGHKYELLYYVATFTGMREGELIGLTWDCIDFERGTIRLYRQLQKVRAGHGSYAFGPLKSRQERLFKPAPQVMDALRIVKARQATWKLKCGSSWQNKDGLVFTHEDGSHLCSDSVYGCFKRLVTKLGMPQVRFHDLRHTFITLSVQNGTDFKTISESVGHATVAFTQDKYGHVSDIMMENAANKMSQLIQSL